MSKKPSTNEEWARDVERRLRFLESHLLPWQVRKGANGDLVAYHLETGQRTVVAKLQADNQTPIKDA